MVLVLGFAALIGLLAMRAIGGPRSERATIGVPAGATLIDTALDGDALALTFADQNGARFVLLVDRESGALLRRFDLVPAP